MHACQVLTTKPVASATHAVAHQYAVLSRHCTQSHSAPQTLHAKSQCSSDTARKVTVLSRHCTQNSRSTSARMHLGHMGEDAASMAHNMFISHCRIPEWTSYILFRSAVQHRHGDHGRNIHCSQQGWVINIG